LFWFNPWDLQIGGAELQAAVLIAGADAVRAVVRKAACLIREAVQTAEREARITGALVFHRVVDA
jgi:hypothetical protein